LSVYVEPIPWNVSVPAAEMVVATTAALMPTSWPALSSASGIVTAAPVVDTADSSVIVNGSVVVKIDSARCPPPPPLPAGPCGPDWATSTTIVAWVTSSVLAASVPSRMTDGEDVVSSSSTTASSP